jgi:hypothetical protein
VRTCLGSLFGDPDRVPSKLPRSLRKRERVTCLPRRLRRRQGRLDQLGQHSLTIVRDDFDGIGLSERFARLGGIQVKRRDSATRGAWETGLHSAEG